MLRYTESHEWVVQTDGVATVGVSEHAQKELGDIVYVELPELGKAVQAGGEAAVLESTKAAADIYSPVSGEIVDVNTLLNDNPELVNESAQEMGWIFKVKLSNPSEIEKLMDQSSYDKQIQG